MILIPRPIANRKMVKQEIENERKSHTGPGFNGISFF